MRSWLSSGERAWNRAATHRLCEVTFSEPQCPRGSAGDRPRACFRDAAQEALGTAPSVSARGGFYYCCGTSARAEQGRLLAKVRLPVGDSALPPPGPLPTGNFAKGLLAERALSGNESREAQQTRQRFLQGEPGPWSPWPSPRIQGDGSKESIRKRGLLEPTFQG